MRFSGPVVTALMLLALTLAVGCSSGSDSNPTQSPGPTLSGTASPTATDIITASPTAVPATPTAEPAIPTPKEWSEENITAQIDSALLLAETLSREIHPGEERFDTALAQAKAGQTGYSQAIDTKDYSSILATVNEFSNVGYSIGQFACYETYREIEGRTFVEFRNLVRNLSSKFESLGYLEEGITQTFEQVLTMPGDCTNMVMLSSAN